jgi:asparagine synthetase B (glutamine-hydrolysing)
MCGIHVLVAPLADSVACALPDTNKAATHKETAAEEAFCAREDKSAAATSTSVSSSTPLSQRRGPDRVGCCQMLADGRQAGGSSCSSDSTNEPMLITVRASVLSMRHGVTSQPVAIRLQKRDSEPLSRSQSQSVAATIASSSTTNNTLVNAAIPYSNQPDAYLAWNGELYQVQDNYINVNIGEVEAALLDSAIRTTSYKDVCSTNLADTSLVASQVQDVLQRQYDSMHQSTSPIQAASLNRISHTSIQQSTNEADCDDTRITSLQEIDTLIASLLHALTRLAHSWTNAEFAFCLVTPYAIFYGRDGWGRRSLLKSRSQSTWILASVAEVTITDTAVQPASTWTEVEPGRVYAYNIHTGTTLVGPCYWWPVDRLQNALSTRGNANESDDNTDSERQQQVQKDVVLPIRHNDRSDTSNTKKVDQEIDNQPSHSPSWQDARDRLIKVLRQAVRMRIEGHESVSLLFSGGLDSVVLAGLVLQCFEENFKACSAENASNNQQETTRVLHLINVSFVADKPTGSEPIAADTQAAIESYKELQGLFPRCHVHLIQERVPYADVQAQASHISRLIYPTDSLLDHNIATALWWAAKAAPDRLVLTGLGADEQLGGYRRHLLAWQSGGWSSLREELDMDQDRLWVRNVGRDDRVICDHGKEGRLPYLDVHVTEYVRSLPLERVVEYNTASDIPGDKRLLRLVAESMGLHAASKAAKRAIQFGSRLSHVCDKEKYGSRRQASRMGNRKGAG